MFDSLSVYRVTQFKTHSVDTTYPVDPFANKSKASRLAYVLATGAQALLTF